MRPSPSALTSKFVKALLLTLVVSASIFLAVRPGHTANSPLIISEFRYRGPNGFADEFIEIYNNTDSAHVVTASDGSSGYGVFASDGVMRFFIPNGTVIPARGHYLGANSVAYSLGNYPAGNSLTADPDATWTLDIPDNSGIALFSTTNAGTLANRLDAVGATSVANTLFREGAGVPALVAFSINYSYVRRVPILGGNAGLPEDTDNNAVDFIFVDTNGTQAGAGQRLGAPGPENLDGARDAGNNITHSRIDPLQADHASPNVVRDFVADPANNATFGKLSIRRTYTNNTGQTITALRFRVINLSTFPAPSGIADLRPKTSFALGVPLTGGGFAVAEGTDLDQPPSQPNGGGVNSSIRGSLVNLVNPLPDGVGVSFNFEMGIQQVGCYQLALVAEALPVGGSDVFLLSGSTEGGSGTCAAPTPTPTPAATPVPGGTTLIISEFRLRGPNGFNDEFIEIYNNGKSALNVQASDGSSGYAVVASDFVTRFVIPNGTVIPAGGHFLGVNSLGYSLSNYPAGSGTSATGDATYTLNIGDNAGLAIFKTSSSINFTLANRLDAVGATSVANSLFREGAGLPPLVPFSIDHSWVRLVPSSGAGVPQDTNNNAADFRFVDTNGTSAGAGQRLGAPGPENRFSPGHLFAGSSVSLSLVDPGVSANVAPNFVRSLVSDPANNSTFGTIDIRRKLTNSTGLAIHRLRVRIIDLTTFPSPSGTADLRARTSPAVVVSLSGGGTTTVQGTTLETPPQQVNGGGVNSSMSAETITLLTPLVNGGSINLRFRFGVQQEGKYKYCAVIETLPFSNSATTCFTGGTQPAAAAKSDKPSRRETAEE
ncbi:MAG TPA: lamin tail domain-containing protein [Pyrinomonadaceae bacterium]|nr:lamin tail domain-containing protein [Pyrinomonadaceae bacterium]